LLFVGGNQGNDLAHVDVHVVVPDAVAQANDGVPGRSACASRFRLASALNAS
jgi:hypothetical protein